MVGVCRAGLPLVLDTVTEGDGHCFFRAVLQQCRRPEIARVLQPRTFVSHDDLRKKVCNFMVRSRLPVVQDFKMRWVEFQLEEQWDDYWKKMAKDKEWADAPAVQGTAWFLEKDIHVIMDQPH